MADWLPPEIEWRLNEWSMWLRRRWWREGLRGGGAGVVHEEEEGEAVEEEGSPRGYEEWVGLGCRNGWWPGS